MKLFLLLIFPPVALIIATAAMVMRFRDRHLHVLGQLLLSVPAFFISAWILVGLVTSTDVLGWSLSVLIWSLPAWLVFIVLVLHYQFKLDKMEKDEKADS